MAWTNLDLQEWIHTQGIVRPIPYQFAYVLSGNLLIFEPHTKRWEEACQWCEETFGPVTEDRWAFCYPIIFFVEEVNYIVFMLYAS